MEETIDTVNPAENINFGKELAKGAGMAVVETLAAYAGAIAILLTVGFIYGKIEDRRVKKAAEQSTNE